MTPAIDHVAMARCMVLGRTPRGRRGGVILMTLLLVVCLAGALSLPDLIANLPLGFWLLLTAYMVSSQATATALRAQRLFAGSVVPSAAARDWRRGWAQGEAASFVGLVGIIGLGALITLARHQTLGVMKLLPGFVIVIQALAAWVAFAIAGRRARLGWLVVLAFAAFVIAHRALHAHITYVVVNGALMAVGLIGLGFAGRGLAPAHRPLIAPRSRWDFLSGVAAFMQRMTPISTTLGANWWRLWASAASNLGVAFSQGASHVWSSNSLFTHVAFMLWFICMVSTTLSGQVVHWRIWLRPGGPRRDRLGRHLFASILQVYTLCLMFLLVIVGVTALLLGVVVGDLARTVVRQADFFVELMFSIALSVWFVGQNKAWSRRIFVTLFSSLAVAVLIAFVTNVTARHPAVDEAAFRSHGASIAYDLVMTALTVVLITLADRAWSRRGLNGLMLAPSRPGPLR